MFKTEYEKELEKARRSGDPETIARALTQLASASDPRDAIRCYKEAAGHYEAVGMTLSAGAQLMFAAEIYELVLDDKFAALESYQTAINIFERGHMSDHHSALEEARSRAFSLRIRLGLT